MINVQHEALPFKTPEELLEAFQEKGLPNNFCIIPFINLIFNPNGDVGVCRQKGTRHIVGNIKNQSIENIWNSDYLQQWRAEFLSGNIKICEEEIKRDACHLGLENYTSFSKVDFATFQKNQILKFTSNFNGQCNLKCKMCDIWKQQNGLYDEINFWQYAKKNFFPFIKEIEMLSGEPFIQKDTYRLIEIINRVNPDCLWSITTNGHWQLNERIKNQLNKIVFKNLIISIDSLKPEKYAKIRPPGKLKTVIKNLDSLIEYNEERKNLNLSDLNITIHFLVMNENIGELKDFIDFANDKNIKLTINTIVEPSNLSPLNLGRNEKIKIIKELLSLPNTYIKRLMRVILPLVDSLDKTEKAHYLLSTREAIR